MIQLGSFDAGVTKTERDDYVKQVETITRVRLGEVAEGSDKLQLAACTPSTQSPMSVADIQQGLKAAGFFPGGKVDGICGYRTRSAMRTIAARLRSTSSSVVAQEDTLMRIAARPCQTVPPHQHVPSACSSAIARRVCSAEPNETRTWLSTTSFRISYPAAASPVAKRSA